MHPVIINVVVDTIVSLNCDVIINLLNSEHVSSNVCRYGVTEAGDDHS